jgi:hypothetical protein
MGNLLSTLGRTLILDEGAFKEWRERPNVFLRGIVLIILISLLAGLTSFGVDLVSRVRPVNVDEIVGPMNQWYKYQSEWFGSTIDPEFRKMWEGMIDVMVPMITDLSEVRAPLPQGVVGFFNAFGGWLSRALTAIGGWLAYGALVLLFVNALGGTAKLPEFLGTVALYIVPGLLVLLQPIPCVGWLLALIGTVWSIVVYIKATSVATDLDGGRATLAVFAPFIALVLLGIVFGILAIVWFAILI